MSATEVLDEHLARIDGAQRRAQRGRDPRRGAGPRRRGRGPRGPLAGVPFTVKEAIVVAGAAGARGLAAAAARDRRARRDRGRAPARGGRDPGRQDEHVRAVRPPRLVEPRLRRDAQPARPGALGRRIERRRGRRGGGGHVGVRHRLGLRRLGARAGELLRPGRHAARRRLRADRRASAARASRRFRERLVDDRAARAARSPISSSCSRCWPATRVGFAPVPARVGIFRDALDRYVSAECAAAVEPAAGALACEVVERTPPFQLAAEELFDAVSAAETQRDHRRARPARRGVAAAAVGSRGAVEGAAPVAGRRRRSG